MAYAACSAPPVWSVGSKKKRRVEGTFGKKKKKENDAVLGLYDREREGGDKQAHIKHHNFRRRHSTLGANSLTALSSGRNKARSSARQAGETITTSASRFWTECSSRNLRSPAASRSQWHCMTSASLTSTHVAAATAPGVATTVTTGAKRTPQAAWINETLEIREARPSLNRLVVLEPRIDAGQGRTSSVAGTLR